MTRKLPALAAVLTAGAIAAIPAIPATGAVPSPVQHVVVIYLENHTFDNLLGYWCQQNTARCPDGGMPASVTLSDGTVVTPSVTPDFVPVVGHQTSDEAAAIDGGQMDGWQNVPGCAAPDYACVSGYEPSQVPNVAQLADSFAISDDTFSQQNSPSWFGHLDIAAASSDGFSGANPWPLAGQPHGQGWGCDSGKAASWGPSAQIVPACVPYGKVSAANGGAFEPTPVPNIPTIMGRFSGAHLPWKIYGAPCASEVTSPAGDKTCGKADGQYIWSVCPSFAACLYSGQDHHLVPATRFISDAAAGLPAFSLITAQNWGTSWHNSSSITAGDNYLGQLVSAVENGPDWGSTAMFITWDDCGCFYDQAAPGVNPDGTPQGPRVPLLIVSPYAKAGFTDAGHATFASILAYAENVFGLRPLSANDAQAYDYSGAFDYSQAPLPPVHMVTRPVPASSLRHRVGAAEMSDPT